MMKYKDLRVGTKVRCLNDDGWAGFEGGGVYEVSGLWGCGIDLEGGYPSCEVAEMFFADFEVVVE